MIDATLGAGGHAEALLEAGVERVIGLDRDPQAIAVATARLDRFGKRFAPFGPGSGRRGGGSAASSTTSG